MDCSVAQTTCGSNMQLHFDGLLMDRMMKLASNRRSWDINFPLEITCPHASFAVASWWNLRPSHPAVSKIGKRMEIAGKLALNSVYALYKPPLPHLMCIARKYAIFMGTLKASRSQGMEWNIRISWRVWQ